MSGFNVKGGSGFVFLLTTDTTFHSIARCRSMSLEMCSASSAYCKTFADRSFLPAGHVSYRSHMYCHMATLQRRV